MSRHALTDGDGPAIMARGAPIIMDRAGPILRERKNRPDGRGIGLKRGASGPPAGLGPNLGPQGPARTP
jgi:hypothetical protein